MPTPTQRTSELVKTSGPLPPGWGYTTVGTAPGQPMLPISPAEMQRQRDQQAQQVADAKRRMRNHKRLVNVGKGAAVVGGLLVGGSVLASMAAPSYAALGPSAAPAVVGGGFGGAGVTAPTFAAPTLIGGGAAVAPAVVTGGGGGGTVAATGISKTLMGMATAAGFLQDFLSNKNSRATEAQRQQATLALEKIRQEFEKGVVQMKIDADAKAAALVLADRQKDRDVDLAKIDPYARTRSQADTMEQLDRLSTQRAFDYDISGLPFGPMMPQNKGRLGYEASPDVRAWAATRGGDVRAGLPSLSFGDPSVRPPVSTTMPVTSQPTNPLVPAPTPPVPPGDNQLRMSIEDLMARRPVPRRRRQPAAMR